MKNLILGLILLSLGCATAPEKVHRPNALEDRRPAECPQGTAYNPAARRAELEAWMGKTYRLKRPMVLYEFEEKRKALGSLDVGDIVNIKEKWEDRGTIYFSVEIVQSKINRRWGLITVDGCGD